MFQTQTHPKKLTFEEYLNYEDDTDYRYELIDGELVTLAPESPENDLIARFLLFVFVSPGKVGRDRDYNCKRDQYAAIGIPEYWIIDPIEQRVMVLRLESREYVESIFSGSDRIISPTFPQLELTAEQILQGQM